MQNRHKRSRYMRRKYIEDFSELERMLVMDTNFSEASHDWKSQASFHGLTHPCWAEPVKRRFPVAVFRYPPCARQHREFFSFRGNGLPFHHTGSSQLAVTPSAAGVSPCSSAMSLISVDKVFVLLWASSGTFAVTACPTVAGRVFKRSRIKYRAPML